MSKTLPLRFVLKSFFLLFLFLSNGVMHAQTFISYPVDNSATDYTLIKAVGLPGGKSAVIYRDAGYNYKCSIVGSNGAVTGTFDFTSKMTLQNIPSRIEVNALGTSSGNIWITYTSSTSDGPPNTINAKYLVLDQSGTLVNSGTVNSSNPGSTLNRFIQMDQLSNGNVVMVWLQSDNMSGGYRIFQSNGTAVTNDASFAGPASSIFNSSNLYGGNRVAANPNGGFLITFYYYNGNFRGMLFDNNGAVQQVGGSNTFTIDPANYPTPVGSYTNISALGLSNGNYMIAWAQNSGGTNTGYYKIISATGSIVKAQTIFPSALQADISTYSWVGAAANNTSSSPGFVIADYSWQDYDDWTNPYAKAVYYNFDLSGNYLSSKDASPYFIADVYGPTVSVYSGNPSGVGVVYTHNKSYTPNGGSYTTSGVDISGSLYGFGGASLSNNAALSNLTLSSGTLSPAFASGTTSYTASVCNATSAITVIPTVAESNATVTVNNTPVTSGSASGSISLAVGANPITVKVTAQDGTTTSAYTITVTRAAALSGTTTVTHIACNGGNTGSIDLTPSGGTAPYTYNWGGGITTQDRVNLVAGSYSVTITDAKGCTGVVNATVTQPTALTATTSQTNVSCNGGANGSATVTVTGGTPGYTYSWAPVGGAAATASGLAAGTYTVTVTDANLCSITRTFTITQPAALTVSSISVPANGTYTGGDDLDFTIAFNQTVTVDPAGGTPYINLTLASGTTRAHYVGGSGTNSLIFRYTVGANDQDSDGIDLGGIFSSGGLIQYASGCAVSDPIVGIPPATGIIIRNPVAQTITFNTLTNKTYGDADFDPGATASSGLAVSYTSSNTAVATIVAGKIHIVGAGSTIITAIQTGNSNYLAATAIQQTLTVNPAMLTITADNQSKVYGAVVTVLTASYSGFVNGDDASSLTIQPVLITMASAISPVGNYAITVTGAASSKYTITYVAGNYAVTPATLTITANNQAKTYGAGVPALTASYSGFVNGDNPSNLTIQPIVTTIATTTSMVGNYTILVGGAASANYMINYVNGSLTVLPAPLTITATNVNKTYGQMLTGGSGSTAFTSNGLMNGETIGSVTIAYGTGASATDAVDTYVNQVTPGGATGETFNPANYSITYANGDIIVGAAASTISFAALPAKTYGDADFAPGATSSNSATAITYTSSNTSVATIVSGKIHIVGAGTAVITASQAADANHTAAIDVVQQLTVNKAAITVVADAKNKIYGESDPALTYYIAAGALVGTDSFNGSLTRNAGEDVGSYVINQGTLALNDNYTLAYNAADLTINKAAITVKADPRTKTYGQGDPALTYQISSGALVGADAFTGSLTRDAGENVGSYTIKQGTLALNNNYILTYTGANLTINKATLTITAEDKNKAYGQNNPVFTASYSGFVNGDNASGLAVQPTLNTTATTTSPIGNYVITASGAADPNYTISYVAGNLSITQAMLTITADAKTKVYGEADPALTYNIIGLVSGDVVTGSLVRTPGDHAGIYAILQGSLSATNNYVVSYQGASFTITPKPVTVTANAQTKTYGQTDPAFTYSVSPALLNGDVLNGALSRTAGEGAGTYAINQGSLNHPDYALSFTGNALTINKAAQQITWVQSLAMGCDGVTHTTLTATASSGLPVSYSSADASIATVNNNEVVMTGAGTVVLTATQPGNNNYLPAAAVQQELTSKLPAQLMVKRWDDVLVFDNSSNQYTAWQWYKNGVAINGATGQYYHESSKLNGDYYAVVKTTAGTTMQTCPVTITPGATFIPISIFPNPVDPGQTITVKTGYSAAQLQGATIVVTNMLGAVVQTVQNVAPQTTITMPVAQGLYAIRLKLANGVTASINALVRPQ